MTDRRNFLKRLSMAMGALALPLPLVMDLRRARGGQSGVRRHLVNMVGLGGWDTSWWHNAFSQKSLEGHADARISLSKGGFETADFDYAKLMFTQKCSDASEKELKPHPVDGRQLMGAGMGLVFNDADYSDILIWRGMIPVGGHGFGNNIIMHGNTSSYAVSFSGLVAEGLDLERRRPLHYVMMADNPGALYTNAAMQSGPSVPTCIATIEQFKNMTQFDTKDFSEKDIREVIASSVRELTEKALAGSARLQDTKNKVNGYAASFAGANFIYGSDFAESLEFKYLHKRYVLAMARGFLTASKDPNMVSRFAFLPMLTARYGWADVFNGIGGLTTKLAPLPPWDEFVKNPKAYEAQVLDLYGDAYQLLGGTYESFYSSYEQWSYMLQQAHSYAFADYLVRYDLSAVVDIPAWPGHMDAHGNHMGELCSLLRTFSCFREMIQSFKSVTLPNQSGTLFDATLLALHSEFDRECWHQSRHWSTPQTAANTGTNHGNTASMLLAGHGVNRGHVISGMHQGPKIHGQFPASYTYPLPTDPASGEVSLSGKQISTLAVMPTILGIFGVTVPAQQVTDWSAITSVIKRG